MCSVDDTKDDFVETVVVIRQQHFLTHRHHSLEQENQNLRASLPDSEEEDELKYSGDETFCFVFPPWMMIPLIS